MSSTVEFEMESLENEERDKILANSQSICRPCDTFSQINLRLNSSESPKLLPKVLPPDFNNFREFNQQRPLTQEKIITRNRPTSFRQIQHKMFSGSQTASMMSASIDHGFVGSKPARKRPPNISSIGRSASVRTCIEHDFNAANAYTDFYPPLSRDVCYVIILLSRDNEITMQIFPNCVNKRKNLDFYVLLVEKHCFRMFPDVSGGFFTYLNEQLYNNKVPIITHSEENYLKNLKKKYCRGRKKSLNATLF